MKTNSVLCIALFVSLIGSAFLVTACSTEEPVEKDSGSFVYQDYCQRCHGSNGGGVNGEAMIAGRAVWQKHPDTLLKTLIFGWAGSGQGHGNVIRAMPPVPYNDDQIAAVAIYTMKNIGDRTVAVTADDVRRVRKETQLELKKRLALAE